MPPYASHTAARPRPSILSKSPVDEPYLSNAAPHASQGRRIRRGLRPHAPTLQRALAPQLPRRDEKRRSGKSRKRGHRARSSARRPRALACFQKFELVVACGAKKVAAVKAANVDTVHDCLRDAPAPLTSFKDSNWLKFTNPKARPPHRSTFRKRSGNALDSKRTFFGSKWSPKPSPELPGCLRKTSADFPLARPETRAAPGRSSARGSLTSP